MSNALSAIFVIAGLFIVISGYLFWGILDYHVTTEFQQAMPDVYAQVEDKIDFIKTCVRGTYLILGIGLIVWGFVRTQRREELDYYYGGGY